MYELQLLVPQDQVEQVAEALDALDALSVSVEDADAHTENEQALFGEPGMPAPQEGWTRSKVVALYAQQDSAQQAAHVLVLQDFFSQCAMLGIREVPDQDWVRLTQSQFAPVEITADFWIVPTWHDVPASAKKSIRLDPGLAFGTGTHPTTRMCLRWIAAHDLSGHRILDYGCGSGILAIGAALHGGSDIDAVDIDPDAVRATLDNAQANGVTVRAGLPDLALGSYDLVLANILATPLKVLSPLLCKHVAPGGHLIMAGILSRQASELQAAYSPYCQLDVLDEEDGWVCMGARFPA